MRFSWTSVVFALAASTAVAAVPLGAHIKFADQAPRSLITGVGNALAELQEGLGVTAVEAKLDALLGNSLTKLEDALGVTFAEWALGLLDEGASPGTIQAIGEGIAMILDGAGVTAVNEFLDETTGGAITSLEDALGVTDILVALGLA
ncbi:hypothetical protein B0I35DRAFT_411314 [Stachybotrys elegans]|uniref:Uncharacterized protein n=1 Tax=Stachybotrys elegans TaxID=80388 RepID=A0A8K0SL58_9HYPO|nr:hypothetical protein B0I35DRAFT_411314 [Stachybotrys elegans]